MATAEQVPRAKLSAEKIKLKNVQVLLLGDWHGTSESGKRSKTPDKFVIGRGKEADAIILDANISRKHATVAFDHENKKWTIIDHETLNGVRVNGKMIPAGFEHMLKHGDRVTVGPSNDYEWIFQETFFKVPFSPFSLLNSSHSKVRVEAQLKDANNQIAAERKAFEEKVEDGQKLQEELQREKVRLEQQLTAQLEALERKQTLERNSFEKMLSANREENESLRKQFEQKLASDKEEMLQKSKEMDLEIRRKMEDEEKKFNDLLSERNLMIETLQSEKVNAEMKMEEERKLFDEKINNLEGNFKNIEKETSKEYQDTLNKLNQEFEEKLRREQQELENAISRERAERIEKEEMKKALEKYKAENDKLQEEQTIKRKKSEEEERNNKKKKEEFEAKLFAKCNDELKCTICDELFISPTSLNCGHVYCKFCIEQWKSRCPSGGFTCPNCRTKITVLGRSLHLENLIEALFQGVDPQAKQDRDRLLRERQEAVLSNNNNDDISLLLPNPRARHAAYRNGRDNPDLVARIHNSVDNGIEGAVGRLHNSLENFPNMLLPDMPLRIRLIDAGRVGATDTPLQAAAPESLQATPVANIRPSTPATARIGHPPALATRANGTSNNLSRAGSTPQSSLNRSANARSSGILPIRVTRPTLPTSTPSLTNRPAIIRLQSGGLPQSITVTAKKIPRPDGDLHYQVTISAGSLFSNDILQLVMEKVKMNFRRANALALHRNEEIPTEITFLMQIP